MQGRYPASSRLFLAGCGSATGLYLRSERACQDDRLCSACQPYLMRASLRQLARNIVHLASGEIPARLCGVATVLFLARRSGVAVVGIYALAQSMVQYSVPVIDFGLRHVGGRLMARYPQAGDEIVGRVQRRRVM